MVRFAPDGVRSARRGFSLVLEINPVTLEKVWEYISPVFGKEVTTRNSIYRAHRVPYDWIPQLEKPEERSVVPPKLKDYRTPAQ
jgi:hypothetical protein